MSNTIHFEPDWLSPPGETIAEILACKGMSLVSFAGKIGLSVEAVAELNCGIIQIDAMLAKRLERTLGPSAAFWMNRETHYRSDTERLARATQAAAEYEWLRDLPIKDMTAFGVRGAKVWARRCRTLRPQR